ncbi:MAG: hypothetical protein WC570_03915 [Patescibacteria group bacterium]
MNNLQTTNSDLENIPPILSLGTNPREKIAKNPILEIKNSIEDYTSTCLPPINKLINQLLPDQKSRDLTFYEKIDAAYARLQDQKLVSIHKIQQEINKLEEQWQIKINQSETKINDLNTSLLQEKSKQRETNEENILLQELITENIAEIDVKINVGRQDENFFKNRTAKLAKKLNILSAKIEKNNKRLSKKAKEQNSIDEKYLYALNNFRPAYQINWENAKHNYIETLKSLDLFYDEMDVDETLEQSFLMMADQIDTNSIYYQGSVTKLNQYREVKQLINRLERKKKNGHQVYINYELLDSYKPIIDVLRSIKLLAETRSELDQFYGKISHINHEQHNLVKQFEDVSLQKEEQDEFLQISRQENSQLAQSKNKLLASYNQLENNNQFEETSAIKKIKAEIKQEEQKWHVLRQEKTAVIQDQKDRINDITQNGDDLDGVLINTCWKLQNSNHDQFHPIYKKISQTDKIFTYFHLKTDKEYFTNNPSLYQLTQKQLNEPKYGSPYGLSEFVPEENPIEKKRIRLIEDLNQTLEKSIVKNLILVSWVKKNMSAKDPARDKLLAQLSVNSQKMHKLYNNNFTYISNLGKKIIPAELHKQAPLDQFGCGHLSEIITAAAIADEQYQRDQDGFTTFQLSNEFEGYGQDLGFAFLNKSGEFCHLAYAQVTTMSDLVTIELPSGLINGENGNLTVLNSKYIEKVKKSWANNAFIIQTKKYYHLFDDYIQRRDYTTPEYMHIYIVKPLCQRLKDRTDHDLSLPDNMKSQAKLFFTYLAANDKFFQDYFVQENIDLHN